MLQNVMTKVNSAPKRGTYPAVQETGKTDSWHSQKSES